MDWKSLFKSGRVRRLEKENRNLKYLLAMEEARNKVSALISKENLPKCKGLYCFHCAYAVYRHDHWGTGYSLLGCGKDADCEHFTPTPSKDKVNRCREAQEAYQADS